MKSILSSAAALLPLFYHTTFAAPQSTSGSVACNNSPSLCSKNYADVTYLGAHDSAFISNSSNSYDISGNQFYTTTTQLNAGVRLLQSQIQRLNSSDSSSPLHLCHTSCSLYDAGPIQNWLGEVKTWMDNNPNEIVTLILVNGPNADAATLGSLFEESGISQYAFTPQSSSPSQWPTLQSMIAANTRLVTFIANLPASSGYLLNEFDYMWENPYEVTSADNFSCTPDRPSAVKGSFTTASSSGRMFMMNHFLYQEQLFGIMNPDREAAGNTNSPSTSVIGSLGAAAQDCTRQYGAKPNYVLVDWFNMGPSIQTVDSLNQVSDVSGRESVPNALLSETSAASVMGRGSSLAALVVGFAAAVCVGWI